MATRRSAGPALDPCNGLVEFSLPWNIAQFIEVRQDTPEFFKAKL